MERPPDGTFTVINEIVIYWHALQAEGQGMVMAFAISILRVIYNGKKFNRRRDTARRTTAATGHHPPISWHKVWLQVWLGFLRGFQRILKAA